MIYSLKGKVILLDVSGVVIECGGVGYRCSVSAMTAGAMPKPGAEATVYTHLYVREDLVELYGFSQQSELNCFKVLISVTGVGPKAALAILSVLSPDRFALCIDTGDAKSLTRAQGIGPKLAQRIVLELKDKVKGFDTAGLPDDLPVAEAGQGTALSEALSALAVLGYSQSDAALMLADADRSLSSGEMIKQALKRFGPGNG